MTNMLLFIIMLFLAELSDKLSTIIDLLSKIQ